jgi:hypothetical protein
MGAEIMKSDLTFELTEFFQKRELRLQAALAIYLHSEGGRYSTQHASIQDAIEEADKLIAELDKTEK